jgi:hypothetical protein
MPDGLAQALVAALIWCALVKDGRTSTIGVGVLSGLLALTAPREVLLLAGVVVAWGLRNSWLRSGRRFTADKRDPRAASLLRGVAVAGLAALIVLPWTVRNALVMDAFVPVSTNSGVNLWIGNNPDAYGSWMAWDGSGRQGTWSYPEDEVTTDRELQREALQHMVNNPVETMLGLPDKLRYTLDQDYGYVSHFAITPREHQLDLDSVIGLELLIDNAFTGVLVLAALAGTAVVIRRERPAELVLVLAGLMLPTLIFLGLDRYHITAIPVLAILASAGAVTLVTRGVAAAAGGDGRAR